MPIQPHYIRPALPAYPHSPAARRAALAASCGALPGRSAGLAAASRTPGAGLTLAESRHHAGLSAEQRPAASPGPVRVGLGLGSRGGLRAGEDQLC